MDQPHPVHSINLNAKLEVFKFSGFSLFLHSTEHNLDKLMCLTKVVLLLPETDMMPHAHLHAMLRYVNEGWRIPQLPLSLCHFILEDLGDQFQRSDFDWSGLQGCPNLEHLTLASSQCLQLPGQLKEWILSVRSLYLIHRKVDEMFGVH